MKSLKIAYDPEARPYFSTERELVPVEKTDFTDVAAVVLTDDRASFVDRADATRFGLPIFMIVRNGYAHLNRKTLNKVFHLMDHSQYDAQLYSRQIEAAAQAYEAQVLPPFFKSVSQYFEKGNLQFDTPGHHGGQFFRKHPAGRCFYDFYGENLFRSDTSSSDVKLGDLLIHEGPACQAERHAAKVYHADKTYFVMNGTSTSNAVVGNALVAPGDLVLFDRNNHKSVYNGMLVEAGGIPVYLETARNPYGFIGGIDSHCFDEDYLRGLVAKIDPERAKAERPFRLAAIQLGTYDGTIYNARQVVERIGHLCDYILFDSAWVGYEQFIPMMRDCSPLLLNLTEKDPGIVVTQSVHKQQAGFSQASQIHKKDRHLKGQARYCNHKRFNNAYMLHASTSPFYPLFASLDVNAKINEGEAGRRLWSDCVKVGINARKEVLNRCNFIKPFIPTEVKGQKWQDAETEKIANDLDYFKFHPQEKWHAFAGYAEDQYFVDPCKFMLTTPGIEVESGYYETFGIPATILANYLRENGVIPEKCDLNSILFLLTPAETETKMHNLVTQLVRFEQCVQQNRPLSRVLPSIYHQHTERYAGYTIRDLCQEMHDFYKARDMKQAQWALFRRATLPEYVLSPQAANWELVRNNAELAPLADIEGKIALEGALPYPPGIICVVPGERWSATAKKYFLALEEGINRFPGFAPEIQGVYFEQENGRIRAYGYVVKDEKLAMNRFKEEALALNH